ncbi:MAG: hypothetical protein J5814_07555 [Bacteroidaceae bacterium]|nr:hypothetical protein [Bacteroidaceae bacterium]
MKSLLQKKLWRREKFFFFLLNFFFFLLPAQAGINRTALLERNNPQLHSFDSLSSLTIGNGGFAMTVDATGLQTFPEHYSKGVPLGTQSDWGWHSFPNPKGLLPADCLLPYDFGHGSPEALYSCQVRTEGRGHDASEWYRVNPHRLHLGIVGFELPDVITLDDFTDISQMLELSSGTIRSSFHLQGSPVSVTTVCHPTRDLVSAHIVSSLPIPIKLHFPYPTGAHADDACNWDAENRHSSTIVSTGDHSAAFRHVLDGTTYFVSFRWEGEASITRKAPHYFVITPSSGEFSFSCEFLPTYRHEFRHPVSIPSFKETRLASAEHWASFWNEGGMVDFSACKDPRAPELERRVVLSQYLLAVNCAGDTPPQETGLTYNSWYGKFHLEMIWWHQAHFALWGHPELLDHTLEWYEHAEPMAREIAERQGFDGIRWMKMTDPSAAEAPSNVGSFLIWQQPHFIHLAELVYRANPSDEILQKYYKLVQATADFMCSFAVKDEQSGKYILKGYIPAQETLRAAETINSPLELSAWKCALQIAQKWRQRLGMRPRSDWDNVIDNLSPLKVNDDGIYLAAESAPASYTDTRFMTDHPAVLGAVGMYPASNLTDIPTMRRTLDCVWNMWGWDTCWGWDFPMTAMCAARIGEPEKAVDALLMDKSKNRYLPNGHNYQTDRLRIYLPGNGGLLIAVAMMCAGWDGAPKTPNPGFPADGTWNVQWEGLLPLI